MSLITPKPRYNTEQFLEKRFKLNGKKCIYCSEELIGNRYRRCGKCEVKLQIQYSPKKNESWQRWRKKHLEKRREYNKLWMREKRSKNKINSTSLIF